MNYRYKDIMSLSLAFLPYLRMPYYNWKMFTNELANREQGDGRRSIEKKSLNSFRTSGGRGKSQQRKDGRDK